MAAQLCWMARGKPTRTLCLQLLTLRTQSLEGGEESLAKFTRAEN